MKMIEMKNITRDELIKRIKDEEDNLAHLKFLRSTSQLENPIRLRLLRRGIARMKTVLNGMELIAAKK